MGARRLNVWFPHVHRDNLNPRALLRCQGRPNAIQALLLPVIGQIKHLAALQIGHHGELAVPLRDGFLIDAEVSEAVVGALGLSRGHDVGAPGPHAGRPRDRRPLQPQHAYCRQSPRRDALYVGSRTNRMPINSVPSSTGSSIEPPAPLF